MTKVARVWTLALETPLVNFRRKADREYLPYSYKSQVAGGDPLVRPCSQQRKHPQAAAGS